jgi:sugar phosphate isomerase/epimerase
MTLPTAKMILHINYCEQGQSIERACRKAREWGFDGIEFRTGTGGMEVAEYLDRIAAAYEKEKLTAIHFGGGLRLNEDKHAENLAAFFHFYEEALKRFSLTVCNLLTDELMNADAPYEHYEKHGSIFLTDAIRAREVTGLREVAGFAEKKGFRIGLETHHGYVHDLPKAARELVDEVGSPALGVTLDYGNIIGFAGAPSMEECIKVLGDSLFYLHLKNSLSTGTRYRQRCGLGDGEINHRVFLQQLQAHGYEGACCLESPRQGDREFFAREDAAYFRRLLSEI